MGLGRFWGSKGGARGAQETLGEGRRETKGDPGGPEEGTKSFRKRNRDLGRLRVETKGKAAGRTKSRGTQVKLHTSRGLRGVANCTRGYPGGH